MKKGEGSSSLKDTYEETRKDDLHVQGTCMYKSIQAFRNQKCATHTCSISEEIDLWKKQSQMKDIDLFRTREELSVTLTVIKRKEGTCSNESTIIVAFVFKWFILTLII